MTESQLKQDLRAVRALFSGPDKWTQGALARDASGNFCQSQSSFAVRWCLAGAILRTSGNNYHACFTEIRKHLKNFSLWQDAHERTFEDMIALLDKAIELAT